MARFRVVYRDGSPPDEVSVGAFSQIAAKRRYGLDAISPTRDAEGNITGGVDPEAALFGVFVEVVGPQAAADPAAFDAWLMRVEDTESIDRDDEDDEDPTPAESSASSPESPPTSESTRSES